MVASPGEQFDRKWGKYVGTALYGVVAWNAISGAVHLYKSDSDIPRLWATRPAVVQTVLNDDVAHAFAPKRYEATLDDYLASAPPLSKEDRRDAEEPWNAAEDWGPDLFGALALNIAQKRIRNERRGNPDYWKFWQPQFWQYLLRIGT